MNIIEIEHRNIVLIEKLYNLWEASVRATHSFLSEQEIKKIAAGVPLALREVPSLIVASESDGMPAGFMGIDGHKIEMLFIAPQKRRKGIGKRLVQYGKDHYSVNEVTVNEENPQAVGFYQHMGFQTVGKSPFDEQGAPYPILYMALASRYIRKLRQEDIDSVMELWLHENLTAHYFIPSHYWEKHYEEVKRQLQQATVYVYERDRRILGFIGLKDSFIAGIFVNGKAQSQGIGKQLTDYVKRDYRCLTLEVYQRNRRAVKFYQREQFTIARRHLDPNTGESEYTMIWQR